MIPRCDTQGIARWYCSCFLLAASWRTTVTACGDLKFLLLTAAKVAICMHEEHMYIYIHIYILNVYMYILNVSMCVCIYLICHFQNMTALQNYLDETGLMDKPTSQCVRTLEARWWEVPGGLHSFLTCKDSHALEANTLASLKSIIISEY